MHRTVFPTRALAEAAVANYIEIFYNHQRPHQALNYQTPTEKRATYNTNQKAA